MKNIKSTETKPEIIVRKYLFSRGLRYRKNVRNLPGTPDIVLPKYHTVIFVNGCFWHQHKGCRHAVLPSSNTEYWLPKLSRTKQRDEENYRILEETGWNVIIIWECELKKNIREETLRRLFQNITSCISCEI